MMNQYKVYGILLASALIANACSLQAKSKQDAIQATKENVIKHRMNRLKDMEKLESYALIQEWVEPTTELMTVYTYTPEQQRDIIRKADALAVRIVETVNASKNKAQEEAQIIKTIKEFFKDLINETKVAIANSKADEDKEQIELLTKDMQRFQEGLHIFEKDGLKAMFYNPAKYPTAPAIESAQPMPVQPAKK